MHNVKCKSFIEPYAQGPKGENVGSITQPLPSNYLIFRAASESDGEAYVELFHLEVYIFACSIIYLLSGIIEGTLKSVLFSQDGAGWMPWSWL